MTPPRLQRYPAFVAATLALYWLLSAGPTRAQSNAPAPDRQTVKVVRTALERAAQVWGTAEAIDGGLVAKTALERAAAKTALERAAATTVFESIAVTPGVGGAVLTGQAAIAGLALVQAAALVGATAAGLQVHLARSGSIARYGNPYGISAGDIAFPLQRGIRARRTQAPVPKPYPIPEPAPVPIPDAQQPDERRPGRLYATYTRYNRATGMYYSGRTSAVIDLNQNLQAQARIAVETHNRNRHGDENAEPRNPKFEYAVLDEYAVGYAVDYSQRYRDAAYLAIRGREQQLIDFHGASRARERGIENFRGGAQSDSAPDEPLTENAIRGVAKDNPFGEIFHAAANLGFGQLAPYTGDRRYRE